MKIILAIFFLLLSSYCNSSAPLDSNDLQASNDQSQTKTPPQSIKKQSLKDKIKNSRFWQSTKFFFQHLQRQFNPGNDKCRGDKCRNTYLALGKKVKYQTEFDDSDHDRASRALQYAIIARHMVKMNPTPPELGIETGLCSTYILRKDWISPGFGTKLALYESDKEFVLAFKGTTTFRELFWVNLNMIQSECKKLATCGRAHMGYLRAFRAMKPHLDEIYELTRDKPLVTCGHSLGGVFAMLTAYDLAKVHDRLVTGVYTFGSPKVGTKSFRKSFDQIVSGKVEVVRVALADEKYEDRVILFPGPAFVHMAKQQKALILPCINAKRQHCTLFEMHIHWNYITALSRVASNKCGIFTNDDNPPQSSVLPPLTKRK